MKAPPFRYHSPASVDEAVALLASLEGARVLAGGQSLMPMMNLRVATPDHLIDLGRIQALRCISVDGSYLRVGAMTTQRELEHSDLVARFCPLLAQAVRHVGHQQTRNRGTIGGSLCHLDPGAELPVVASALDAELTVASPDGARTIQFADFPEDYLTPSLRAGEIVTSVRFPLASQDEYCAFLEFNRRPADFAIVSAAVRFTAREGLFTTPAIAVGGVGYAPVRLPDAEAKLAGAPIGDASAIEAAAHGAGDIECIGDELYPPEYRRRLCATLVRRALQQAAQQWKVRSHA